MKLRNNFCGTIVLSMLLVYVRTTDVDLCDDYCIEGTCQVEEVKVADHPVRYPSCTCPSGYAGFRCNRIPLQSCQQSEEVCKNGGTCHEVQDYAFCECSVHHFGDRCQYAERVDIPYCENNIDYCGNNGHCITTSAGLKCDCDFSYHGDKCENQHDPCDPFPCEADQKCVKSDAVPKGYNCEAKTATNTASTTSHSRATPSSSPESTGTSTASVSSTSTENPASGDSTSKSTTPSVTSDTSSGTNSSLPLGVRSCENGGTVERDIFGIDRCKCPSKREFNNSEAVDIRTHVGLKCQFAIEDGVSCYNREPTLAIDCNGQRCVMMKSDVNNVRYPQCICGPLFTGEHCETSTNRQCLVNVCKNGGTCYTQSYVGLILPVCVCPPDYTGPLCQTRNIIKLCEGETEWQGCNSNGTEKCTINTETKEATCHCDIDHFGDRCQHEARCKHDTCKNGGVCLEGPAGNSSQCDCNLDMWEGDACEEYVGNQTFCEFNGETSINYDSNRMKNFCPSAKPTDFYFDATSERSYIIIVNEAGGSRGSFRSSCETMCPKGGLSSIARTDSANQELIMSMMTDNTSVWVGAVKIHGIFKWSGKDDVDDDLIKNAVGSGGCLALKKVDGELVYEKIGCTKTLKNLMCEFIPDENVCQSGDCTEDLEPAKVVKVTDAGLEPISIAPYTSTFRGGTVAAFAFFNEQVLISAFYCKLEGNVSDGITAITLNYFSETGDTMPIESTFQCRSDMVKLHKLPTVVHTMTLLMGKGGDDGAVSIQFKGCRSDTKDETKDRRCPDNYKLYNGKCLKLSPVKASCEAAHLNCSDDGGVLSLVDPGDRMIHVLKGLLLMGEGSPVITDAKCATRMNMTSSRTVPRRRKRGIADLRNQIDSDELEIDDSCFNVKMKTWGRANPSETIIQDRFHETIRGTCKDDKNDFRGCSINKVDSEFSCASKCLDSDYCVEYEFTALSDGGGSCLLRHLECETVEENANSKTVFRMKNDSFSCESFRLNAYFLGEDNVFSEGTFSQINTDSTEQLYFICEVSPTITETADTVPDCSSATNSRGTSASSTGSANGSSRSTTPSSVVSDKTTTSTPASTSTSSSSSSRTSASSSGSSSSTTPSSVVSDSTTPDTETTPSSSTPASTSTSSSFSSTTPSSVVSDSTTPDTETTPSSSTPASTSTSSSFSSTTPSSVVSDSTTPDTATIPSSSTPASTSTSSSFSSTTPSSVVSDKTTTDTATTSTPASTSTSSSSSSTNSAISSSSSSSTTPSSVVLDSTTPDTATTSSSSSTASSSTSNTGVSSSSSSTTPSSVESSSSGPSSLSSTTPEGASTNASDSVTISSSSMSSSSPSSSTSSSSSSSTTTTSSTTTSTTPTTTASTTSSTGTSSSTEGVQPSTSCPEGLDTNGVTWSQAVGGETVSKLCVSGAGFMSRTCSKNGEWQRANIGKCVSKKVQEVTSKVEEVEVMLDDSVEAGTMTEAVKAAAKSKMTDLNAEIRTIVEQLEASSEEEAAQDANKAALNIADAGGIADIAQKKTKLAAKMIPLLTDNQQKIEMIKAEMEATQMAGQGVNAVVKSAVGNSEVSDADQRTARDSKIAITANQANLADIVAEEFLDRQGEDEFAVKIDNIEIIVAKLDKTKDQRMETDDIRSDFEKSSSLDKIMEDVAEQATNKTLVRKLIANKNKASDYKTAEARKRIREQGGTTIGSDVTIVEGKREAGLSKPVKLFRNTYRIDATEVKAWIDEGLKPTCVFFEEKNTSLVVSKVSDLYSPEGCKMVGDVKCDDLKCNITCECVHLTNFAILMQVEDVPLSETDEKALELISIVGLSISIFCLAVCLIILLILRKLKSERIFILKNLVAVLMFAQLLFVTAVEHAAFNNDFCLSVTIILHYSFLSVFFWMLNMGLNLVFLTQLKPKMESMRVPLYCVLGYGVPAIITAVTAGIKHKLYGKDDYCWLSTEDGVIYAFVGPALTIIGVNFVVLIYVVTRYLGLKRELDGQKMMAARVGGDPDRVLKYRKDKITAAKTMVALRGGLILTPLLGFTWIFGVLSVNKSTIAFQYLFNILNCLQGLAILICGILLNKEVKKAWQKQFAGGKVKDSTTELNTTPSPQGSQKSLLPTTEPNYQRF